MNNATQNSSNEELANLKAFADAVIAKAQNADDKFRFGRNKVFIAALEPSKTTKRMLMEAHKAGFLRLCRADLTDAHENAVREASRIAYGPSLSSAFHLIDLRGQYTVLGA